MDSDSATIKFSDPDQNQDLANYEIESQLEENSVTAFEKSNEGQISFQELNDSIFQIIHRFNGGIGNIKIIKRK
jgi:hypothetical protein